MAIAIRLAKFAFWQWFTRMNSTMTNLPTRSRSGLPPTGVPSSPASGEGALVIAVEFNVAPAVPLKNTRGLDALLSGYEADSFKASKLAEARRRLARLAYNDKPGSLSQLRLAAGLSQAQLASRAGTSQSHVARIELGQNDPGTDVVVRLAVALGVAESDAFGAIRLQRRLGSSSQ